MIITLTISCDRIPIPAGHQGENAARQIRFSLAEFLPPSPFSSSSPSPSLPEGAVISLLIRRPGEDAPYPGEVTPGEDERGAPCALWTPSSADTALAGTGECELRLLSGDTLIKSRRYPFTVEAALGRESEPPPAGQFWVDRVCAAARTAENAASALTAAAEQVSENTSAIAVISDELTRKADTGGLYEGLTAGSALRLTDPDAEEITCTLGAGRASDIAPIHGRAAARIKAVLGRTCVRNQLYDPQSGATSSGGGVTYTNNRDGTWTLTGTGTSTNRKPITNISCVTGHTYYMAHGAGTDSNGTWYVCVTQTGSYLLDAPAGNGLLFTAAHPFDVLSVRTMKNFSAPEGGLTLRPVFTDVTLLCGTGNEPETVAELLKRFPDIREWRYDPGTLMHASVTRLVSRKTPSGETEDSVPAHITDFSSAAAAYFPDGLMSTGDTRDELREDRAIRRCRAENGTVTALEEAVITPVVPPLSLTFPLYEGGSIGAVTPDGAPSAPADFILTLTPDVISAVNGLSRAYASMDTLDALLELLGARLGVTLSREWDAAAEKWTFTAT